MNEQRVSLGCGTLILIALIVMIFSGGGVRGSDADIRVLRNDVARMSMQLQRMQKTLDEVNGKLTALQRAAPRQE